METADAISIEYFIQRVSKFNFEIVSLVDSTCTSFLQGFNFKNVLFNLVVFLSEEHSDQIGKIFIDQTESKIFLFYPLIR